MSPVILLAGGLGTRLKEVSGGLPKPLIDVAGRPFIEYVMDHAIGNNAREFILAVSYHWEQLHEHLGDEYRGCPIRWSVEDTPKGTGGAILQAMKEYHIANALVMNADTFFPMDLDGLCRLAKMRSAHVGIALRRVPDISRYGAVMIDDDGMVRAFGEKSGHGEGLINGGIYCVSSEAFDLLGLGHGAFSFEQNVLMAGVGRLNMIGQVSDDAYFIDIGIPEDLSRARLEFSQTSL